MWADEAPTLEAAMARLRIGTWNIGARESTALIFNALQRYNVDICAFQEVNLPITKQWIWEKRVGNYQFVFHPTLPADLIRKRPRAHYGLALASRIPYRSAYGFALNGLSEDYDAETEPRILQMIRFDEPLNLFVGNTHLSHTPDWSTSEVRALQADRIGQILAQLPQAPQFILCGDFNASSECVDLHGLRKVAQHLYSPQKATYVGENQGRIVDFFLARRRLRCEVFVYPVSSRFDHHLIVLDLSE